MNSIPQETPFSQSFSRSINPIDLAWLAGLIEGEGSFSHHVERKQVHSLRIRVVMSDEDVVRRCLMVSGLGTFHGPHQDMRNPAYKLTWAWQVSSREETPPRVP